MGSRHADGRGDESLIFSQLRCYREAGYHTGKRQSAEAGVASGPLRHD